MRTEFGKIVEYRGKWCAVVYIDGQRKRLSLGNLDVTGPRGSCKNYPAAERAAADLKRQLAQPTGNTCADIFDAYLKDREASERRLVDKERLDFAWKRLKPHFAAMTPEMVTRDSCRAYIAKRRKDGVKDGTIRKELTVLRAALNWHDKRSPAVFDMPPPPPPKDRYLTEEEFLRLLDEAKHTFHLQVFLHLALATAGRKEALFEMTWSQVRWERNEIFLGFKVSGKKRATVPMTPTLRAVLQQAKELSTTDYVIEFEGERVSSVRTSLEKAAVRAGLIERDEDGKPVMIGEGDDAHPKTWVSPHVIRHSAAVWMASKGVALERICDYLGHSDISVTKRVYAKFQPEHLGDAAAALDIGLGPSGVKKA